MKALLVSLVLLTVGGSIAQQPAAQGELSQVMTAQQRADTGIDKLSPADQNALHRWFLEKTLAYSAEQLRQQALAAQQQQAQAQNGQVAQLQAQLAKQQADFRMLLRALPLEDTIKSVTSDGSHVVLEDGSVWEVEEVDRIDSQLWLQGEQIYVLNGSEMLNWDDHEKVDVRRIR